VDLRVWPAYAEIYRLEPVGVREDGTLLVRRLPA
jgi:hypothetical protein